MVKNLPEMRKTSVQSLGQEDPLEKVMVTHTVFSPGESHGQRSLAGCSPWGHRESNTNKQLSLEPYRLPMIAAFGLIIWAKVIKIIKILKY